MVMESTTYWNRLHGEHEAIPNQLEDVIDRTVQRGGNIVIPSFAVERAQDLFDEETVELLEQGKHPCDFPGLEMTRSVEESKAINTIRGSAIIIAGSGMCTGGRIKHHLKNNISRSESTILFVGYQVDGTLGRQIVNGADTVVYMARSIP